MWLFLLLQSVSMVRSLRCGRKRLHGWASEKKKREKKQSVRLKVAGSYLVPLRDAANAWRRVHVATHRQTVQTLKADKASLCWLSLQLQQATQIVSVFPAVCDFVFSASRTRRLINCDWALWCHFRGIKHLLIKSIPTSLAQQCPTCRRCWKSVSGKHSCLRCRKDPAASFDFFFFLSQLQCNI